MKVRSVVGALSVIVVLGLVMTPAESTGLTCRPLKDFSAKVQAAESVVIGEIVEIKDKHLYQIRVVKILKDGGTFGPKVQTFEVRTERYTQFGFPTKKGQLILFFLHRHGKDYKWTCNGPILIR